MAHVVAATARAFADGGYVVFVDGVVGPWHLPAFEAQLGNFDYAILDLNKATAVDRMQRRGDGKPEEEGVALLWQFFQRYPEVLARHRLNAATDADAVMNEFENRRAAGELVRFS